MKPRARFLVLFAAVAVFCACGCSRAVYVHVFNRASHTISILGSGGDAPVDIPAGASARVFLTSITRGRDHGFAVIDSGIERFYVVASHLPDGRLAYPPPVSFPRASRKTNTMVPELLVEYSDSLIFALDASIETVPNRLNPQPPGFPLKPHQTPEPIRTKGPDGSS